MLIVQGLVLTAVGMLVTFAFLCFLVILLRIIAKVVPRFDYLLPKTDVKKAPKAPASGPQGDDVGLAIAIAAATSRSK